MKCPTCDNVELKMTDRQGIEIDYCPTCRGVWLDRGELDKIIERSASDPAGREPERRNRDDDDRDRYDRDGYERDGYRKGYKKRGFFGDLFDFD
jgi:Zn-finger nucleic acid-binding protein